MRIPDESEQKVLGTRIDFGYTPLMDKGKKPRVMDRVRGWGCPRPDAKPWSVSPLKG